MDEHFKIHPIRIAKEEQDRVVAEANQRLFAYRARPVWRQPFEGEQAKNNEQLVIVNWINNVITEDLENIGVEALSPMPPERIHFLDEEAISKIDANYGWDLQSRVGAYRSEEDIIVINLDYSKGRSKFEFYANVLHEILHHYSYESFDITYQYGTLRRSGYTTYNNNTDHEHFRGFNEAVLEKTLKKIISDKSDIIAGMFNISKDTLEKMLSNRGNYREEIRVLEKVIDGISKERGVNSDDVFKKIKKGFFTGDMMQLRLIEEVYGPGSLRVLAAMGSRKSTKTMEEENLFKMLEEYFSQSTQEKRDFLAKEILATKERLAYKKHVNLVKNN